MRTMALYTAAARERYAQRQMAQPLMGFGPWGQAIRYWLNERKMRQADLVREVHKANPDKTITANTISNAARGLHCSTRTLEQIAIALRVRLDEVLVSPDRQLGNEDRRRLALEISQEVLRTVDARRSLDESFVAAEAAAKTIESQVKTRSHTKKKR